MRDRGKDVEHQFAGRRISVDVFLEADQVNFLRLQRLHGLEKLPERAPEAVKPRHGQGVARPGVVQQGGEARPVEGPSGNDVLEHADGAVPGQAVPLSRQVLVRGRDPRMSEDVSRAGHAVSKTTICGMVPEGSGFCSSGARNLSP